MTDWIKQWKEAHPEIEIVDEAQIAPMAPFPSLYANDLIAYISGRPDVPEEVTRFVKDISREMVWVYDNWQQAQIANDPGKLLSSIINDCFGPEYEFTKRVIADYAKSHNIRLLPSKGEQTPSWIGQIHDTP